MSDRRQHQPDLPGPPGGELPPIEDEQTYRAVKHVLAAHDEALPMISTPDTRRGLQRWANAMRRRIREYEAEHGGDTP
jgi:hypothetical protein